MTPLGEEPNPSSPKKKAATTETLHLMNSLAQHCVAVASGMGFHSPSLYCIRKIC